MDEILTNEALDQMGLVLSGITRGIGENVVSLTDMGISEEIASVIALHVFQTMYPASLRGKVGSPKADTGTEDADAISNEMRMRAALTIIRNASPGENDKTAQWMQAWANYTLDPNVESHPPVEPPPYGR